jgi:hypothetical protein
VVTGVSCDRVNSYSERGITSRRTRCCSFSMTAEQSVVNLKEIMARVEYLLSYYRGFGEEECAVVKWLEVRLDGVAEQMQGEAGVRNT